MDEPFAALDEITRFRLNNDLLSLWRNLRKTVIFVTHSVFESVYLSQRRDRDESAPGRIGAEFRIDAPEPRPRSFAPPADYARLLSARFRARWRRLTLGSRVHERFANTSRRGAGRMGSRPLLLLRIPASRHRAGAGIVIWESWCGINDIPPYVLPAPSVVSRPWSATVSAVAIAADHPGDHARRVLAAAFRRHRAGAVVSTSRNG